MNASRFPYFRGRRTTARSDSFEPLDLYGFHGYKTRERIECEPLAPFLLDERVAWRFNAYAKFAFPSEIGGMLRIVGDVKNGYRAIDLKVFPHTVANGSYFELDGEAISTFLMDLVRSGRREEVGEWRALVHSHPGFAPRPSGTDRTNLLMLASEQFAFSLICSAYPEPERNYHLVHYAQPQPLPLVLNNITPRATEGGDLAGLGDLTEDEIEEIRIEVDALLPKRPCWQKQTSFERTAPRRLLEDKEEQEIEACALDPLGLDDDEYVLCDEAIEQALQACGKGKRRHVEQLLDLRLDIDHQDELTRAQLQLLFECLDNLAQAIDAERPADALAARAIGARLEGESDLEPSKPSVPAASPAKAADIDSRALLADEATKNLCHRALHYAQGRSERAFAERLLALESLLDAEERLAPADVDALQAALDLWIEGAKVKRAERLRATIVRRALLELL
jgi:proteasome lid subunit RPN8/RPN11